MHDDTMRFSGDARRERVRLHWWKGQCSRRGKGRAKAPVHWSTNPPELHMVVLECLGTVSLKKNLMQLHGVMAEEKLPYMNDDEQFAMLEMLQAQLESQTGLEVSPIARSLVDWEGREIYGYV